MASIDKIMEVQKTNLKRELTENFLPKKGTLILIEKMNPGDGKRVQMEIRTTENMKNRSKYFPKHYHIKSKEFFWYLEGFLNAVEYLNDLSEKKD